MDGMESTVITEIAEYFRKEMGYDIPPITTFVAKTQCDKSGNYAGHLEEIYNIFNTKKLLKRAPGVSISNTSGLAGIAYWINEYFQLEDEKKVSKDLIIHSLLN